jgi:hypothetical protein
MHVRSFENHDRGSTSTGVRNTGGSRDESELAGDVDDISDRTVGMREDADSSDVAFTVHRQSNFMTNLNSSTGTSSVYDEQYRLLSTSLLSPNLVSWNVFWNVS